MGRRFIWFQAHVSNSQIQPLRAYTLRLTTALLRGQAIAPPPLAQGPVAAAHLPAERKLQGMITLLSALTPPLLIAPPQLTAPLQLMTLPQTPPLKAMAPLLPQNLEQYLLRQ